jgi:hypothetical protein
MELAGHEANDFGCRYLHEWEAHALSAAGYMAPLDFCCPGTWRLSIDRIPIPLEPHGEARVAAISQHFYDELTLEQGAILEPENNIQWTNFFRNQRNM